MLINRGKMSFATDVTEILAVKNETRGKPSNREQKMEKY
jgi:hypothetical protein